MSIGVRFMREGQEDAVAAMVRALPKDLGQTVSPKITGESLRQAKDLVRVTVAEDSGLLLGCCVWMPVFSTWRGAKGVYVCDLYVMSHARGRRIGERILKGVAREAKALGATYLRLEVDEGNPRAAEFYQRLGFAKKLSEQNHFLETVDLDILAAGEKS